MTATLLHDAWELVHLEPEAFDAARPPVEGWREANVPGCAQTSAFGMPREKLYQLDNVKTVQWMEKKLWLYRRCLRVPQPGAEEIVRLVFHGLDYRYRVFIDRQLIVQGEGMFHDVVIPLNHLAGRDIEIMVALAPPPLTAPEHLETTKGQFSRGWDFTPTLRTTGIWDDVTLEVLPRLRITDAYLHTQLHNQQRAHVTINVQLSERVAHGMATIELCGSVRHFPLFDTDHFSVPVEVLSPQLWWPNGLGEPTLHDLRIQLDVAGRQTELFVQRVGLRDVRRVPAQGQRTEDIPLQFVVNGLPVFLFGMNWVPVDACVGDIRDEHYERFLPRFREGGVNLIRVWGGGLLEKKHFYRRCDELGLLVMQEFPLACGMGKTDAWLAQLQSECTAMVRRLRSHPSVFLFTGGNENYGYWDVLDSDDPILKDANEKVRKVVHADQPWAREFLSGAKKLYDEPAHLITGAVAAAEAGHCLYQNTSAMEGEGEVHGIWNWNPRLGDHRYRGYATLYDYWRSADQHLYSEASVSGLANLDTIRFIFGDRFRDTMPLQDEDIWKLHHALHGAWDSFRDLWFDQPSTEKVFGPLTSLTEAVVLNQYLQGEGGRFMIEELRRKQPRCVGVIWWGSNEPWPGLAGNALIDYFGRPKSGWKFIANAFRPTILTLSYAAIQPKAVKGDLWISCNDPRGFRGRFDVVVESADGLRDHYEGRCNLDYYQSLPVKRLTPMPVTSSVTVHCRLFTDDDQLVHENRYLFGNIRKAVLH